LALSPPNARGSRVVNPPLCLIRTQVLERNVLEDAMSEDASATRTLPGLPRAQAECRADAEGFAVDLGCNGPAEVVPTRSKAQAYINEELDLMKRRGALR
jgi:hypothetical protein